MQLTDILSQYFYEMQYEELQSDEAYQTARAGRNRALARLEQTMSPEQLRLLHAYIEQANDLDVLELNHFFSRCSLLLLPQKDPPVSRETIVSL